MPLPVPILLLPWFHTLQIVLLEVVSIFAAATFHFRRVSVPNGSYHNWSIRMIHRRYLACLPDCVPSFLSHYCVTHKDRRRALSLLALQIMSCLHLSFMNNTDFFFFFPEWLCSWLQQSSFGSGKNNLAALAQRQMSPQIRCHGSISAPVLASSRGFHTSHWCVQEIRVQMLLQKAGSHFASAFSRESFHNRFALLSCSVCCCSLLLVRAAAFPACLPHLSRMSSSFVYRHMLVIH